MQGLRELKHRITTHDPSPRALKCTILLKPFSPTAPIPEMGASGLIPQHGKAAKSLAGSQSWSCTGQAPAELPLLL